MAYPQPSFGRTEEFLWDLPCDLKNTLKADGDRVKEKASLSQRDKMVVLNSSYPPISVCAGVSV